MIKPLSVVMLASACAHQTATDPKPLDTIVTVVPPITAITDAEVRSVATRFVAAAEKHDFATAYSLLSGTLRDRYTPERLAHDYEAEPLAGERLARIRAAALTESFSIGDRKATLPLGARSQLTMVKEGSEWRVSSLE